MMEGFTGSLHRISLSPSVLFRAKRRSSQLPRKGSKMQEPDRLDDIARLRQLLHQFAAEREWQPFHTPKNLASALIVEAAELLEPFQWLTYGEKQELNAAQYQAVRMEMADVFCYLLMMADRLQVDLVSATEEKIHLNAQKYPVDRVRGSAQKYHEYLKGKEAEG